MLAYSGQLSLFFFSSLLLIIFNFTRTHTHMHVSLKDPAPRAALLATMASSACRSVKCATRIATVPMAATSIQWSVAISMAARSWPIKSCVMRLSARNNSNSSALCWQPARTTPTPGICRLRLRPVAVRQCPYPAVCSIDRIELYVQHMPTTAQGNYELYR